MKPIEEKLYKNALIGEKLAKLNKIEKQKIIVKLLATRTERELAEEIGIPHSVIHDWKSLRQSNIGEDIHCSLSAIYRKLSSLQPGNITDWGRIEQIKSVCEQLLKKR